jgi:hypothetical protein
MQPNSHAVVIACDTRNSKTYLRNRRGRLIFSLAVGTFSTNFAVAGRCCRRRWAQPSVTSIADCMRAPQRDRDRYGSRARENSFVVMEKFSWEAAANKALRVLDERKMLSDDLFPNAHVT